MGFLTRYTIGNDYKFTGLIKEKQDTNKNYHLLDYLLPSEDLEDLKQIQDMSTSIETYDFMNLIKKYDLKDYIVTIIYKIPY